MNENLSVLLVYVCQPVVSSVLEVVIVVLLVGIEFSGGGGVVGCVDGAVVVPGVVFAGGTSAPGLGLSPFEQPAPSKAMAAKRESAKEAREGEVICFHHETTLQIGQ